MKSSKKIGIVGYGYVGRAMTDLLHKHYDLLVYDPSPPQGALFADVKYNVTKETINQCDVAIICVPTPMQKDKSCDISIVEAAVQWLEVPLILIKSTVEIGTTDRLKQQTGKHIVFSPEYCGESSYWTPYNFHTKIVETPFFIFGGAPEDTSKMVELFLPVCGPTKVYRQTTAKAAETAKYMENSFYATKIIFCYEMKNICDALGIDFYEVRELWLLDPRINPMHTAVFAENRQPYSGKCLPKDINGLIELSKKAKYVPEFLMAVEQTNKRLSKNEK